jgi:hypothetical protein
VIAAKPLTPPPAFQRAALGALPSGGEKVAMPTLDWIGNKAVLNHHRQVPYRLLHCDRKLSPVPGTSRDTRTF